ncbi:MAG: FtsQ-type POTRA domain-containing protein [Clostridioides sp.]|nr:FtsQ-type POTRA domain-containing protein [Clostridioides sp.]
MRKKLNPQKKLIIFTLIFAISLGVAICLSSDLFEIKNIEIDCSDNIKKSNILNTILESQGKNIFMIRKKDIKDEIIKNPYITDVKIDIKLPNTIKVLIEETSAYVAFENNGNYCYVDKEANLLEEIKGEVRSKKDKIVNIDYFIDDYDKIKFKNESISDEYYAFIDGIQKYDLYTYMRQVDFKTEGIISMVTTKNTKVVFSDLENIDYDLNRVSKVIKSLDEKEIQNGSIDLSSQKYTVYKP